MRLSDSICVSILLAFIRRSIARSSEDTISFPIVDEQEISRLKTYMYQYHNILPDSQAYDSQAHRLSHPSRSLRQKSKKARDKQKGKNGKEKTPSGLRNDSTTQVKKSIVNTTSAVVSDNTTSAAVSDNTTVIEKASNDSTSELRVDNTTKEVKRGNTGDPMNPSSLPGKKGIGLVLKEVETALPQLISLRPYWNYHWGPARVAQQPENIEFVPMIWTALGIERLQSTIDNVVMPLFEAGLARRLLGFNEPDNSKQANMPVSRAVECWPMLEIPGVPLASPAVATLEGAWMSEFVDQVESLNYTMNYIAVHWYGPANAITFKNEMLSVYQTYGQKWPLLITEFAPADWSAKTVGENRFSQRTVLNFMKNVIPWIEQQDWIYGYAWFPFKETFAPGASSALFDINGNMTALGKFYSSVRTTNIWGDQSITL